MNEMIILSDKELGAVTGGTGHAGDPGISPIAHSTAVARAWLTQLSDYYAAAAMREFMRLNA